MLLDRITPGELRFSAEKARDVDWAVRRQAFFRKVSKNAARVNGEVMTRSVKCGTISKRYSDIHND